jgi:hypothetical protein
MRFIQVTLQIIGLAALVFGAVLWLRGSEPVAPVTEAAPAPVALIEEGPEHAVAPDAGAGEGPTAPRPASSARVVIEWPEQPQRTVYLLRTLKEAPTPRERVDAADELAGTKDASATQALCAALRDGDLSVRRAAADALAKLGDRSALDCLYAASGETAERNDRVFHAIAALKGSFVKVTALMLCDPNDLLSREDQVLGGAMLKNGLESWGALVDSPDAGAADYRILVMVTQVPDAGLRVEASVNAPSGAPVGSWSVKARGGTRTAQLKALLPSVAGNIARDLRWQR